MSSVSCSVISHCFLTDLVQIRGHKCCVLFVWTSIMCPLNLRYANVGSLGNLSLSIYDRSLIPGNSLVALL